MKRVSGAPSAFTPASWGFRRAVLCLVLVALGAVACGKKGPPLPPFIRIPDQPGDLAADRRGDSVVVSFVVPATNADGSRPANVDRVEVYAVNGPAGISEADILATGERIATIPVNPPPEPDAPPRPAVEGAVDQGAVATFTETLMPVAAVQNVQNVAAASPPSLAPRELKVLRGVLRLPVLPPAPAAIATRVYLAVPIGGRRTGESARSVVPLVEAPAPPAQPTITYDESEVTVTWGAAGQVTPPGLLTVRPLPNGVAALAFHVYEVTLEGGTLAERRLTTNPMPETSFVDPRVTFGTERCYTVRVLRSVGTLAVESEAPAPACVKMVDTFPPAAPEGLTTVPSDGAISLIWDSSEAADLGGYVVLRGEPGGQLSRITTEAIQDTSYRDVVPSGTRAVYAVQAVDKEGNVSEPSALVEDTAR